MLPVCRAHIYCVLNPAGPWADLSAWRSLPSRMRRASAGSSWRAVGTFETIAPGRPDRKTRPRRSRSGREPRCGAGRISGAHGRAVLDIHECRLMPPRGIGCFPAVRDVKGTLRGYRYRVRLRGARVQRSAHGVLYSYISFTLGRNRAGLEKWV